MADIITKGVIPNMPRAEYDAIERVHWSALKNLLRSPAHYQHALTEPRRDTDAMKIGRCAHLAILEPDLFASSVAVWSGGRRAGKEWDAFESSNAGRELLKADEYEQVIAIQKAVHASAAAKYLTGGGAEQSVFWTHEGPEYSVDCKGRLDFLSSDEGVIVDLKITRDADPARFFAQSARLHYHAQAAFYRDGYLAATGEHRPFVLVCVESEAPYVVQVYCLPADILDVGRYEYQGLLDRLHSCRSLNRWGGYADVELDLVLPSWAMPPLDDGDVSGLDLVIGGA